MSSRLGTVVVGFDGSPSSLDALALGGRVATSDGATLVAAFVYRVDMLDLGDNDDYTRWVQAIAERELAPARSLEPSVETVAIGARSVARGLHELAEERDAGLLVVGGTHHGAIGRVVPGSTAQRLLDGSPCPVAVAPRGWAAADASLSPIVVGYDGEDESLAAVRWAAAAAAHLTAPLRIVSVIEPPAPVPSDPITFLRPELIQSALLEANERLRAVRSEQMQELARTEVPDGVEVTTAVLDGRPADLIVAQVPGPGGLVVVGSRGYGPLGAVLMGSVAAEVLREAHCPVTVIPRRR